ncbi:hypothetical protein [Streptomyces sp. TRM68367]|uniref:hypothetical protein n=1 Tax=Streptomyces sp. TRM68367 TaxID=2758415 RepID=UPI00165AF84E|nr:hypothetical protein [Streptomyces sp. TRM68367]MBC9724503.1 hypothetical protein [Streptomyces sp. TRM68367]
MVVTACLAAALPRAIDRYGDAGLLRAAEVARPERTSVQLSAPPPDRTLPQPEREAAPREDVLRTAYDRLLPMAERSLPVDRQQSSYGVGTVEEQEVPDPWLPRPDGLPARMVLAAQDALGDHARLREGRLPRANGTVTAATGSVEAAVSADTARDLRIKVGSVLHFPGMEREPLAVRVTGIVDPHEPRGAYWSAQHLLGTPALVPFPGDPDRRQYWLGALLLHPDAAPAMLGTAGNPARYWQVASDLTGLHAHDISRLTSAAATLESGPGLQQARTVTDPELAASTDLDDVLHDYDRLRSAIGPLIAVAAFGTGTVAAVVLLMAGGLAADPRRGELALLRARGGSLRGISGRLLAETAVVAVPAAALGLTAALLALPGARLRYAVAAAVLVALLACLALPLRAATAHRAVRVHTGREDITAVRPSRRRTVAELTLLVLAVGAVVALRRRGTGSSGDQLVSLAPVLVAVIAALVLVRLIRCRCAGWPVRRGGCGVRSAICRWRARAVRPLRGAAAAGPADRADNGRVRRQRPRGRGRRQRPGRPAAAR